MIYIDFRDAIAKARKMEEEGSKIKNKAVAAINLEGNINSNWKGDSASLLLKKYDKHARNLKKHAEDLMQNAYSLRKSAERLKAVEDYAVQLFNK